MVTYIHELADWPQFHWSRESLAEQLAAVRHRQGRLIGRMEGLGLKLRAEATLRTLTEEVVKSSEIEGEILNKDQVRSSLARIASASRSARLMPADRNVEGIVEMILDATEKYDAPLTAERLFGWHAALFPTGRSGIAKDHRSSAWRTEDAIRLPCKSSPGSHRHREHVHYRSSAHCREASQNGADEELPRSSSGSTAPAASIRC